MKRSTRILAWIWIGASIRAFVGRMIEKWPPFIPGAMADGLILYCLNIWPAVKLLKGKAFGWWMLTIEVGLLTLVVAGFTIAKPEQTGWLVTALFAAFFAGLLLDRPSKWTAISTDVPTAPEHQVEQIVACPHCGTKNRIPTHPSDRHPVCGKCARSLEG